MRLLELVFNWGSRPYRVGLTGAHHCVVVPPEVPLQALRDGVCAAFYGTGGVPNAAVGDLRHAGVAFEANGGRYRLLLDLSSARRLLLREGGGAAEVVADQPASIGQALTGLLHLPSAQVYRSLTLADVAFPAIRLPRIPPGAQRALLAHAQAPEHLRAEHQAARQQVEAARLRARRSTVGAPWSNPAFLGGAALGVVALGAALFAPGAARMAGLGAPFFFGVSAWRTLQWIDATESRSRELRGLDEAEGAARVRKRHLDELEQMLAQVESALGSRRPEIVAAALASTSETDVAPEVQANVEVYAGEVPASDVVAERVAAFGLPGAAAATAGFILAGLQARGGRTAPLFWMAEGHGADGVTWDRVFGALTDDTPLFVFCHQARPVDRPVPLEVGQTGSGRA